MKSSDTLSRSRSRTKSSKSRKQYRVTLRRTLMSYAQERHPIVVGWRAALSSDGSESDWCLKDEDLV